MSKTYIVNVKNERYNYDEWVSDYKRYLDYLYKNTEECESVYNDPDDVKHTEFYNDLEKFLNKRENDIKLKEKWSYKFDKDNYGIQVFDEKHVLLFTIFSDQFGFSAPCNRNKNKPYDRSHPYDVYAEVNSYSDASLKEICKYVYYSRTLGGSFLWPIDGGKEYNKIRGGTRNSPNSNYIEDRVDLTLLEIKKYYDKTFGKGEYYLQGYLTDAMRKWLDHFENFETYVNFFCFNNFVFLDEEKNYIPKPLMDNLKNIDILNGKSWKRLMKGREKEIEQKDREYILELQKVFDKLINMINSRTNNMEKVI